jgi:excisionase family DNA binding protein
MENQGKQAFRVSEAARLTGFCEESWRRWLRVGAVQGVQVGKTWLIPRSVVEAVVAGKPLPQVQP